MNIVNCGNGGQRNFVVKFLYFRENEEGILLFGGHYQHKEVWAAYCDLASRNPEDLPRFLGAGMLPCFAQNVSVEEEYRWGFWESVGYGVTTPPEIREEIRQACLCVDEETWDVLARGK